LHFVHLFSYCVYCACAEKAAPYSSLHYDINHEYWFSCS
jgi:hypothetical protein